MRVGVLGGGQLARMMALAGHPLGITCTVLDPAADACAGTDSNSKVTTSLDRASRSSPSGES